MGNNIELNYPFIHGLNEDVSRLISVVDENTQLDEKLYKAEFATGGYNGTCSRCFKDLKNEELLLVSTTRDLNNKQYKICTCLECSKKVLNEFKSKYINRR